MTAFAFKSLLTNTKYRNNKIKMTIDENFGYDAFGTLTRQGPVPFLIRVFQTETYNAAVDKYMRLGMHSLLLTHSLTHSLTS